jgi:predicted AAA+ superfamily ATPase
MFERSDLQLLKKRIEEPRRFIQVVMGPRQVGKTTLVSQLFEQLPIPGLFESADAVGAGNSIWLEQIWDIARFKMKTLQADDFLLIIDEIQKISNWSETVKKLWDQDNHNKTYLKVILLGSSCLLLHHGLSESLAGRFENIYLTHWTFEEMNKAFGWDADTYAWYGGYPGSVGVINEELRWKKYIRDFLIETSISKDILMLTRIDKPALLRNMFDLGCIFSGQVLSFTKLQGQLQDAGNTTTLSHYLKVLESAGLLCGLEKFSSAIIRKRSSSPKFQVHNNALLSAQNIRTFQEIQTHPAEWGRVVESSIGAYLVNQSIRSSFMVYYWRESNEEVDFILENRGKIIALEIKSNYSKSRTGMESFNHKFKPYKTYCIDKKGIPWQEFLKIDPLDLF